MVNIVIADIRKALEGQELCLFYFRILSTFISSCRCVRKLLNPDNPRSLSFKMLENVD